MSFEKIFINKDSDYYLIYLELRYSEKTKLLQSIMVDFKNKKTKKIQRHWFYSYYFKNHKHVKETQIVIDWLVNFLSSKTYKDKYISSYENNYQDFYTVYIRRKIDEKTLIKKIVSLRAFRFETKEENDSFENGEELEIDND